MSIYTANVYGQIGGEPKELPYIKKTGDTATGLIKFEGGLETDIGTATFNGPVVLNSEVTFTPNSTLFVDGEVEFANDVTFTGGVVTCNVPFTSNASVIMNNPSTVNALMTNNAGLTMKGGSDIDIYDNGYIQWSTQGGGIIYTDQSLQTSAYTGAKTLAGNYTNTNITIGNQGQISAISNGSVSETNPIGSMMLYAGPLPFAGENNPPLVNIVATKYLHCNGATVSSADYPQLFALIGLSYTFVTPTPGFFQVPDLRKRMPMGAVDSINRTINTQGYTGLVYGGDQVINVAQLPPHTHGLSFPTNTYVKDVNVATDCSTGGTKSRVYSVSEGTFPTNTNGISGAGAQNYFVPNFTVFNYIIRALP
jgi:microcystin-dependent protein